MSDTSEAKSWITGISDLFGRRAAQILILLILIGVGFYFLLMPYLAKKANADTPISNNGSTNPDAPSVPVSGSLSKNSPTGKVMEIYAQNAGNRLQQCCGPGGRNSRLNIANMRIDAQDRRCIIQMTVTWQGRKTGSTYSISGKLMTDYDGSNPEWLATGEKGIVLHNCATGCNLGRTVRY